MEQIDNDDKTTKPDDLLALFSPEANPAEPAVQPETPTDHDAKAPRITGLSELAKKPSPGFGNAVAEADKKPVLKIISKEPRNQGVKTLPEANSEEQPYRIRKTFADELSKKKKIDISFGESLREMRIQRKISIEEIANSTKINKDYIEALENEDFSRLPPAVFVCGYVRKMCELYTIPDDIASAIIKSLKANSEYRLSEECMENIIEQDDDLGREIEPRIRSIAWLSTAVALFIVMVIVAIVIFSFSRGAKKDPTSAVTVTAVAPVQFDPEELNKLSPRIRPSGAELPVPK